MDKGASIGFQFKCPKNQKKKAENPINPILRNFFVLQENPTKVGFSEQKNSPKGQRDQASNEI